MPPPLVAQLAAFCAADPIRPKVLVGPSRQAGAQLRTALARHGSPCAHVHVTTPAGWAERCVAPRLQAAGWTRLARGTDRFLLHAVLRAVRAEAPLEALPGSVRVLHRTIRDLRGAGITPAALRRAPLPPARRTALARVLAAYEARLAAEKRYDEVTLFRAGAEQADAPEAVYALLDATPLSAAAHRFLRAVAGDRRVRIGTALDGGGASPPPDSVAARWAEAPHPDAEGAVHPATALWSGRLSAGDRESVRLRTALGAGAEVRGVLRDVLDRGLPFDQVEIAYPAATPYRGQLLTAAERFEVPVTLAAGRPALSTPTGSALRGFFQWIAQGSDSAVLADLCRARLVTFDRAIEAPLPPPAVAAMLDRFPHGPGRYRHRTCIDRLEARCDPDDAARREQLQKMRAALDALAALVPEGGPVSIDAVAAAGIAFVERFGPGAPEGAAYTSLTDRLRDIAATVGALTGARDRLAARLQRLVEAHAVEAAAARPGALHAAPLDRAGYTGRPHRYVVGLDEGAFPASSAPDPVLPAVERRALDGMTPPSEPAGAAAWHLARVLSGASAPVTLSARRYSLAEGAPVFPAPLFQRAADQLGYEDPADAPSAVPTWGLVPAPDALALDATEALLAARHADGFVPAVRAAAPWLVQGAQARAHRAAPTFTRFDGLTGQPAPAHALGDGATPVSATRLETLAACPFRYFLTYVLGVEPPDTPAEDPTRWLAPLQFGQLLHELYRTFMERRDGPVTAPKEHEEALMNLLEERIATYRDRVPVQHEAAFRADRQRLERAARVFLAAEAQSSGATPVAFEVSFGQGVPFHPHRPAPVPLTLTDDVQLRLEGRIDRVDRLPNGDYVLWDYKTGSMHAYDAQDLSDGGQRLQWALYAYAFEAMRADEDAAVARSGYFFANGRAYGQRLADAPPPREVLGTQLAPLLDLAAQGAFPHVQKRRDACRFCDYRRLCADETQTARDVASMIDDAADDPVSRALARWMELA